MTGFLELKVFYTRLIIVFFREESFDFINKTHLTKMKYLTILCFCFCSILATAQQEKESPSQDLQPLDLNSLEFESFDFGDLDLESLDLQSILKDFDGLFNGLNDMNGLDSLSSQFGQFGDLSKLFGGQLGELGENQELLQDLMNLSMKTLEQLDLSQMEGLMEGFMKDFEGLNLDELLDQEEVEKIMEKHAKSRKI